MLKKKYLKSHKAWNVVFELPKTECPQDVKIRRVNLMGDFNDWKPSSTPMSLNQDVYAASLELDPGHDYQFRYLINGKIWCNDWHADTYVPNLFGEENCVVRLPGKIDDQRKNKTE